MLSVEFPPTTIMGRVQDAADGEREMIHTVNNIGVGGRMFSLGRQ